MFLYPPLDWNLLKGKNHTSFNFIAEVPRTQMFELWNILVLKATGDMLKLANILFHPLIKIDLCQSPWVCFERFHTIGKCWSKGRLIIKKERETATNWLKVKVWKSLSHVRLFATPWTGVGSLSLLQGIFLTQGSNPGLPHCRWVLYQLSHRGSPHPDWELKYEGIDTMNYIPKTKKISIWVFSKYS